MRHLLALAPLLFAAPAGSATTHPVPNEVPAAKPGAAVRAEPVAIANRAFGVALYRRLAAKPGNVFLSPISLAGAFGPVAAGARGETRAAIGRVLELPKEDAALHRGLGGLLRTLETESEGARVSIANSLWLMKGVHIKPGFVAMARDSYGAEVDSLDFTDGAAAAGRINNWVERETGGRIRDLFAPDTLDVLTRVVITNAVHFLGAWTKPFNATYTRPKPFHLAAGGTRDVPMMSGRRDHRMVEVGPVQLIELPYKGERLAMVAILPKKRLGLDAVEAGLTDARLGQWLKLLDSETPGTVDVQLPRVTVEARYKLNEPLKAMGMAVAFDPRRANFHGITDREQLFISQVVHKTFLRIDEKGTEAAAATGVEIQAERSAPEFIAEHPFLVLIRDKQTGAVLFLGRIADPAPR